MAGGDRRFGGGLATVRGSGPVVELCLAAEASDDAAREAAAASACAWALDEGGARTVRWTSWAGDLAGWRVAWSLGFGFDGTTRRTSVVDGELVDSWHATLLAGDPRQPAARWLEPTRLEVPGLVIRDLEDADERRYLEAVNDPESHRWLSAIPLPRGPEQFAAMMRRRLLTASLGQAVHWAVADADSNAYLAHVTLFELDGLDHESGEVGYRAHPDARGRGVVTRALRAVLAHAFAPVGAGGIGLARVQLLAGEGNAASAGVARACGFRETGRDRRVYLLPDGQVVDLLRFDVLRSEFAV